MLHEQISRGPESFQYKKPRRIGRMITSILLISLLILLLVGGIGVAVRYLNPTPVRTTTEMHTFNLTAGATPTLIVTNDAGFIHVRVGTGNTVTVTTTKIGDSQGASPDDFKVNYSQNGNTLTVQVNDNGIHFFDFSQTSQADLTVTVPINSNLRLVNDSGDITATGIHGEISLNSNSGSVQATDVSLAGGSRLESDSGNVTVQGSIGTSGQYTFQSNSGNVDVALPGSASFHASLVTNSGSITSEFPLTPAQQSGSNAVHGDVGNSPEATVSLQSDSGDLHLRKM